MYVDETVLNFMGSREFESSLMANETVEATVLLLTSAVLLPSAKMNRLIQWLKLLNSYFDVMVKEIIAQGGYIDKFIGDAIMAVFRGDYHLDRAIDACLAVRNKIDSCRYFRSTCIFTQSFNWYQQRRNDFRQYWFGKPSPAGLYRYRRCGEYRPTITISAQAGQI